MPSTAPPSATLSPSQPTGVPTVAPPQRSMLIDITRGLAIFLVALGHTDQGVIHRQWWGSSSVGERIDGTIYAFHMPAFFFISGIFLRASVNKRGELRFVAEKLRTILWPYLLFSVISAIVIFFLHRFMVQAPLALPRFFLELASGQLSWFLPTIFFAVICGMFALRLPMPAFFLIAVALSSFVPQTPVIFFSRGLKFLPFLALGMWVGSAYQQIERIPLWLAALLAPLCCVVIAPVAGTGLPEASPLFIPIGILGTFMLLLVARLLGRTATARFFSWAGEASFGIFLLAAYPQGFGRELLLHLHHITNPWLQMIFPTLLAVAIPAWLYHHRHRLHIAWMFIFPVKATPPPSAKLGT